jgi:hypothetical protein
MELIESERGKKIVGGNYPRGVIVRGAIVLLPWFCVYTLGTPYKWFCVYTLGTPYTWFCVYTLGTPYKWFCVYKLGTPYKWFCVYTLDTPYKWFCVHTLGTPYKWFCVHTLGTPYKWFCVYNVLRWKYFNSCWNKKFKQKNQFQYYSYCCVPTDTYMDYIFYLEEYSKLYKLKDYRPKYRHTHEDYISVTFLKFGH